MAEIGRTGMKRVGEVLEEVVGGRRGVVIVVVRER